jgi:glucose-1-phosphate adenylyltransferase
MALASMGIYVFGREFLKARLGRDSRDAHSAHDFGRNIIPGTISTGRVFAYSFQDVKTKAQAYWRDVGTVDAFFEANMELVYVTPELNLYDEDWPIWTYQVQQPPAKFVLDEEGRRGLAINSLVSGGSIISGAAVRESLLFSSVRIDERSYVERAVILPSVHVGHDCVIKNAIIDEGCDIAPHTQIGVDRSEDARRFYVTDKGVVLVTADMLVRSAS